MALQELTGWMAAALTLLTFSMQSMVALRVVALTANLAFIAYGTLAALNPVLFLHLLLLPCNLVRLTQILARRRGAGHEDAEAHGMPGHRAASTGESVANGAAHGSFEPGRNMAVVTPSRPGPDRPPRPGMTSAVSIGAARAGAARLRTEAPEARSYATACAWADGNSEAVLQVVQGRVCVLCAERPECVARAEAGELVALPPRVPEWKRGDPRVSVSAGSASTGGHRSR